MSGCPDPCQAADLTEFIALLGRLRVWAGSPSYRALAKRVGPLLCPPQTVAQSTVGDVFQSRRRRLDLDLVVAIVRALGLDAAAAARWRDACVRVHDRAGPACAAGVCRQLPPDLATFTGRESALKELLDAVAAPAADRSRTVSVAVIEGMGGVGKTRLAVRAAHELVRGGRFCDLQLYVNLRAFDPELAPADPAEVLDGFLRALDVPARRIPAGLEPRAAMFRDRMHGRQALMLLDDAAGAEQVRPLIPAGPDCQVLITSRRSLVGLDDAVLHRLEVFDPAESLELLERIAGPGRVRGEPRAAEAVVELCGRLPMAVALVAARLRARPAWSLEDLLRRLRSGRLETVRDGGRSLRAVFDLSHRALPGSARRMFRLLGVHPGDTFTSGAAAALAGVPEEEADRLLEVLTDEYLLRQPSTERYEFHDLIRVYAAEQAAGDPERAAAFDALLAWYVAKADAAVAALRPDLGPAAAQTRADRQVLPFADPVRAAAWCAAERRNLLAVLNAAVDRPAAWRLPRALYYSHVAGVSGAWP